MESTYSKGKILPTAKFGAKAEMIISASQRIELMSIGNIKALYSKAKSQAEARQAPGR